MIELLYFASQIQCSADASLLNIEVDVYHQQQLVQTMSLNDQVTINAASIDDLDFEYRAVGDNAICSLTAPTERTLEFGATLPDLDGVYNQNSIQNILSDGDKYEELLLVELGTTDNNNEAFDLQDVIFKVDTNPDSPVTTFFAD
ncbi:MAG: hypothetical protein AAF652_04875 [Cyanobacteria bacterium P01_C01_bin.72]